MDDEVTPITLSFASVKARLASGREILQDVSGVVRPGQTLALLGSSGAGKTTLLSILANRIAPAIAMGGGVFFNGQKAKASSRTRFCSFVAQETAFMGDFTVRETLRYAALFQLGRERTTDGLINGVIAKVGLASCADSKIGSLFFKGISGGQMRRLALAIELLKKPSVIFLDEPLTNLDAASAYQIVLELKNLARQQHTVVFSAHAPSSRLLDTFDQLIVLSRGKVAYFGNAAELQSYLGHIGKPVPEQYNPCDHLMHLLVADADHVELEYAASQNKRDVDASVASVVLERKMTRERRLSPMPVYARPSSSSSSPVAGGDRVRIFARPADHEEDAIDDVALARPSMNSRISTLVHRAVLGSVRNPGIFAVRLVFFAGVGLFLGALFFGTCGGTSYSNVRSCVSMLLGAVTIFAFLGILSVPFIIDDAKVYAREKHNGAYGAVAFTVTMFLRSIVFTFAFALLASLCTVYMGQLNNFWLYFTCVWATLMFAEAYAIMWSVLTKDYLVAVIIIMSSVAGFMMLSGFFIVFDQISWAVRWLGYASPMRYAFRAMLEQQFSSNLTYAPGTPMSSGAAVLDFLGVAGEPFYWGDIGLLLGFCAVCFAVVYVVFEHWW